MSVENDSKVSEVVTVHRYGWTGEEVIAIGALALGGVFFIVAPFLDIFGPVLSAIFAVIAFAMAGFLFWLGNGRKKSSKLVGTLKGDDLHVVGNNIEKKVRNSAKNAVNLTEVTKVYYFDRPESLDEHLVFSNGEKSVHVPARLAAKSPLFERLDKVIRDEKVEVSQDVQSLINDIRSSRK